MLSDKSTARATERVRGPSRQSAARFEHLIREDERQRSAFLLLAPEAVTGQLIQGAQLPDNEHSAVN
jgi:hypothetical protein